MRLCQPDNRQGFAQRCLHLTQCPVVLCSFFLCFCVRVRLHAVMFVLFFLWLRPNTKVAVWQSRVPGLQDECLLTAHILFDRYGNA